MSSERAVDATPVLLVRHGRTEWNERGRIQGHTDIPLSEEGRARLRESRIPSVFAGFRWHSSPLVRAVESARLLGASLTSVDARLMEMHWGEWEGETRAGLRTRLGERMRRLEDRGIDFRPPGGESPRELTRRLEGWLRDVRAGGQGVVAVTHKGVLRAALALATGWDLRGSAPCRLDWEHAHLFSIREGGLEFEQVNIALHPDHVARHARGPGARASDTDARCAGRQGGPEAGAAESDRDHDARSEIGAEPVRRRFE